MTARRIAVVLCVALLAACGGNASRKSSQPKFVSPFPSHLQIFETSTTTSAPSTAASAAEQHPLGVVTENAGPDDPSSAYRLVTRRGAWDGKVRTWHVAVPRGVAEPIGRRNVLFVLHGVGANGIAARSFGFESFARRDGTVLVYPDAYEGSWNDARVGVDASADRENVDDSGFLTALVGDVRGRLGITSGVVWAAGFSNGGIMTAALACLSGTPFVALGVVAASGPPRATGCAITRVPVVVVQGTADPVVPFDGGAVRPFNGHERGRVLGHPEYMMDLIEQSSCSGMATSVVTGSAQKIAREQGEGCLDALLAPNGYVVYGGAHEWFRMPGFDSTEVVWNFFQAKAAAAPK